MKVWAAPGRSMAGEMSANEGSRIGAWEFLGKVLKREGTRHR